MGIKKVGRKYKRISTPLVIEVLSLIVELMINTLKSENKHEH